MLDENITALSFVCTKEYPNKIPFDPPQKYPEYMGNELNPDNEIYDGVRNALRALELDKENFDTAHWNPFGEIIEPGMTVFIKPNTVVHEHERKGEDVFSLIVHGSVLRPVLDYVCVALQNRGRIIIGDSQLIFCDFNKAMAISQINELLAWYKGKTSIPIECFDLRTEKTVRSYLYGRWKRVPVNQDPMGYKFVDLGEQSYFKDIDPSRLRIGVASHKNMYKHHKDGKHEYLFPKSFLESDVVISIPKLKTHRRTAVTLALKNFMGIPAWKDSLPHFITGSVEEGGDQYIHPSKRKKMVTWLHDQIQSSSYIPVKFILAIIKKILWNSHWILPFKDDVYEAMWYGNDTLWRTLLDLNRAVLYADKEGVMQPTRQRKFFGIIDGVIAGEKNGPLCADCVLAGAIIAGHNPVTLDAVGATLMGFDIDKIPLIRNGFEKNMVSPVFSGTRDDIKIIDSGNVFDIDAFAKQQNLKFEPHPNWKSFVELD